MKKLTILAAVLLVAGAAKAQNPTNQYQGTPIRPLTTVTNPNTANDAVAGASQGDYAHTYQSYSQDSYISQVGNYNNATVKQTDGRAANSRANGGSTAVTDQHGDYNTANQTQTLVAGSTFSNDDERYSRSLVKSTQSGSSSQSDQTQTSGGYNREQVTQGAGTTGNRAIQTQSIDGSGRGAGNQAVISQTKYSGFSDGRGGDQTSGSGNRAEQDQSGYNQRAEILQESSRSYASQTQRGGGEGGDPKFQGNSAGIHQGAPGDKNTAIQEQSGNHSNATINQAFGSHPTNADNNYARQSQSGGDSNNAIIDQKSSNNYAEEIQRGNSNYSSMSQSNVSSAAYSTQQGNHNSATVTQQ